MRDALEKCPLCGSDRVALHPVNEQWQVICDGCGCNVGTHIDDPKQKAIKLWNTRAALSHKGGEERARVEAVADAIEQSIVEQVDEQCGHAARRADDDPTISLGSCELDPIAIAEAAIQAALTSDGWAPIVWQGIATAPKDGTHIMIFAQLRPNDFLECDRPQVLSGYWDEIDGAWCSTGSTFHGPFYDPTHWMPLPPPPTPDTGDLK